MSGNQEDGTKWRLPVTKINYNYAQKQKLKQDGKPTLLLRLPRSD
jgi:hypothetical protein